MRKLLSLRRYNARGQLHNMKIPSISHEKHGVTEMVAYVAMIIVAFSISTIIYTYLQVQTPKDRPECPEGVSLGVQDVTCTLLPNKICNGVSQGGVGKMDITLVNNGKRSISGAFIRFGLPSSKVKESINKETPFFKPLTDTGQELLPGKTLTQSYTLALDDQVSIGEQSLEIEPVIGEPNNLALCEDSIVTRKVTCTLPIASITPETLSGNYIIGGNGVEPGNIIADLDFSENYDEYIEYFEANLYKKDALGVWIPYSLPQKKSTCPEANKQYSLDWTGLDGGDSSTNYRARYKIESFAVFYDGTRVPMKYQGVNTYEFTIFGCKGTCVRDFSGSWQTAGAHIELKSGGTTCNHQAFCSNRVLRTYDCTRTCYTGDSSRDSGIITEDRTIFDEQSCGGGITLFFGRTDVFC